MDIIIGGFAFIGFIAAHLFAVVALRDTGADSAPVGHSRRIA